MDDETAEEAPLDPRPCADCGAPLDAFSSWSKCAPCREKHDAAADRVSTPQPEPAEQRSRDCVWAVTHAMKRSGQQAGYHVFAAPMPGHSVGSISVSDETWNRMEAPNTLIVRIEHPDGDPYPPDDDELPGAAAEEAPPEPAPFKVGDFVAFERTNDRYDWTGVIERIDSFGMAHVERLPSSPALAHEGASRTWQARVDSLRPWTPPPAAAPQDPRVERLLHASANVGPPEPARPEWVKLTGRSPGRRSDAGKVVKVDSWAAGGKRPGVGDRWLYDDEWVPASPPSPDPAPVAAPVDEPEPAPKFAVGDRVEVIETRGAQWIAVGQVLTVVSAPAGCPQPKDDEVCVPTAHGPCCYPVGCFRAAAPAPSPDPRPHLIADIERWLTAGYEPVRGIKAAVAELLALGSPEPGDDGAIAVKMPKWIAELAAASLDRPLNAMESGQLKTVLPSACRAALGEDR